MTSTKEVAFLVNLGGRYVLDCGCRYIEVLGPDQTEGPGLAGYIAVYRNQQEDPELLHTVLTIEEALDEATAPHACWT